jgi:glycosyltransferase involved in cell wall biosynthesis
MGISVVIPNFNHAKLLPRALRGLLRQVPAPDEIIVVDDASTDGSIGVIETFQRDHGMIRLVRHASNRGAPAALNTGLAAAKGEFVYFGAADDFVLPDFFSAALTALKAFPDAAYFCAQVVLIDRDGAIIDFRPVLPPGRGKTYISPAKSRRLIRTSDNWAVGQSVVARRQLLLEIGGFNESLGSFCDGVTYRLLAFRRGFYYSNQLVAAWEINPDSFSARSALSGTENLRLIEAAKACISETFPPPLNTEYPELFARRLRFNMARVALIFSKENLDVQSVSDLVGFGVLDRLIMSMLGKAPYLSRVGILAWLTLRLHPFGIVALVRSWLDKLKNDRSRRKIAADLILQATK